MKKENLPAEEIERISKEIEILANDADALSLRRDLATCRFVQSEALKRGDSATAVVAAASAGRLVREAIRQEILDHEYLHRDQLRVLVGQFVGVITKHVRPLIGDDAFFELGGNIEADVNELMRGIPKGDNQQKLLRNVMNER